MMASSAMLRMPLSWAEVRLAAMAGLSPRLMGVEQKAYQLPHGGLLPLRGKQRRAPCALPLQLREVCRVAGGAGDHGRERFMLSWREIAGIVVAQHAAVAGNVGRQHRHAAGHRFD